MTSVFKEDRPFRAKQQGALQALQSRGGVARGPELHERHGARAPAPAATAQQPQPREPGATALIHSIVPALVPRLHCVRYTCHIVFVRTILDTDI